MDLSPLKLVEHKKILKDEDIVNYHKECIFSGYEGIMLRKSTGPYKADKRSSDLLKYKLFMDDEFKIVGHEINRGKCENQCSLICVTKEGHRFKVKPEGSEEQREWYLDNIDSLIGKYLTVRFFSWTNSKNKLPRFPVGISVRDYE